MSKYAYTKIRGPAVQWAGGYMPYNYRAADTLSLGSLGGPALGDTLLPAPGAPEPIGVTRQAAMSGCSCSGSCNCTGALAGIADAVPGGYLGLAAIAAGVWWFLRKR